MGKKSTRPKAKPGVHSPKIDKAKKTSKKSGASQGKGSKKSTAKNSRRLPPASLVPAPITRLFGRNAPSQVPTQIQEHRHDLGLNGRYFYSLPSSLLREFEENKVHDRIAPEAWEREKSIASRCEDHQAWVGVRNDQLIGYSGLSQAPKGDLDSFKQPGQSTDKFIEEMEWDHNKIGINEAKLGYQSRILKKRYENPFVQATMAYPGWLMTNPGFLSEQNILLEQFKDPINRWGTDRFSLTHPPELVFPDVGVSQQAKWLETLDAFQSFLGGWQLMKLAGPGLPQPLGPLMGNAILPSMLPKLREVGGLFFLPGIAPLPSREELRDMLRDSLYNEDDQSHFAEWRNIVSPNSADRGPMRKFQGIFRLQHYWRILHVRHPQIFDGNLVKVRQILAKYLGVGPGTIKSHLKQITKRLGEGWETRNSPLE